MNYVKRFKFSLSISLAVLLAGIIVAVACGGLNFGIDFTGGTQMTVDIAQDFALTEVVEVVRANGLTDAPVLKSGSARGAQTSAVIRFKTNNDDAGESALREKILAELRVKYPQAALLDVTRIDGSASATLVSNALFSILIASVAMLVYIWIRFAFWTGVATVVALLHDVVIMLAVTSIIRLPINSPFIAAVLTILGYSINNTIVVFDRIRQNAKPYAVNMRAKRDEIVNTSVRQSVSRSINTSLTTLFTIVTLYILGVQSLREFALPIIVGIVAGTFSSIFIAAPAWSWILHKTDLAGDKKRRGGRAGRKPGKK